MLPILPLLEAGPIDTIIELAEAKATTAQVVGEGAVSSVRQMQLAQAALVSQKVTPAAVNAGEITPVGPRRVINQVRTFGRYDDAVGFSVTINAPRGDTKESTSVLGTDAAGLTRYRDRDHVGLYVGASSFPPLATGGGTRYGANSITAPEITPKSVKPGMIIDTQHEPPYVAIVSSVHDDTAEVGGWYRVGSGKSELPAGGVGAIINPNTKIWGANINVLLPENGQASKAVGIELGLRANKPGSGVNTWGYDAITLGGEKPLAHFISRGQRVASFLASAGGGDFGYLADAQNVGFESRNSATYAYSTLQDGKRKWSVNGLGALSRKFEAFRVVQRTENVGEDDVFLLVKGADCTLKLPSAKGQVGRQYIFRAESAFTLDADKDETIDGSGNRAVQARSTVHVISDGRNWVTF